MSGINAGNGINSTGILQPESLVAWKKQQGLLKVPVPPSKVIISPQLRIVQAKERFYSKKIKGLTGTHLCVNPSKGIYLCGGWGIGAPALIAVCEELRVLGATEFYLAGIAGRLTDELPEADAAIAGSGISEEGTSAHYMKDHTLPGINCPGDVQGLSGLLSLPVTKFVSTDAPYRETAEKCREWRAKGATMIDMETTALYTFATFYDLKAYTVGVGADLLSADKWTMAANYGKVEQKLSKITDLLIESI